MQSVGTRLREARIKKGYTLEDINARTRISLKNLTAIESDDLSKISSPFTYRSFVKQIADLVDLDYATLASDVLEASRTMPEPLVPGQEEVTPVRFQQIQTPKMRPNLTWVYRTASIAAIMGAVSAYLIWRNGGIEAARLPSTVEPVSGRVLMPVNGHPPAALRAGQTSKPPILTPVAAKIEQRTEQPAPRPGTEQLLPPTNNAPSAPTQVPPRSSSPAGSVPAALDGAAIHIELSAIEPTWLSIAADGKTTYAGVLGAMETKVFDGKTTAQIRTGNAGGVNIIFNGRALGPLGRRGQMRTFVFTQNGYEVVQGVGSPIATHESPTGE
jgi:cytoskeleton protein RodZ